MNELILHFQRTREIPDDMLYKNSAIDQSCFMRDIIGRTLLHVPCFNISWHRSKSIVLPVYGLVMLNGIKLIIRDNFYDIKVSVELPDTLPPDFIPRELVSSGYGGVDGIHPCYCEGFREEWCYGPYMSKSACNRFTIEVSNRYKLYTLLFLLKNTFTETNVEGDLTDENALHYIDEIYERNGFYTGEMKGWEILECTERAINHIDEYKYETMYLMQKPDRIVEIMNAHPSVKEALKRDIAFFKTKF